MPARPKRKTTNSPEKRVMQVFAARGWKPFKFQREAWKAYANGESGLVHAPTGTGKTYAVWAPTLIEWLEEKRESKKAPGLRILWITPLRALVQDTTRALLDLVEDLEMSWTVQARTGDTSSSVKAKQRRSYPTALVTTPESLSLLLSYPETREQFSDLKAVIVDEWHELLSTKRGVQTELGLARLRQWNPKLKTWGLSATLGNLDEALDCLVGTGNRGRLINGDLKKKFVVKTVIPRAMDRLPWSGHLGSKMVGEVVKAIEQAETTLVFTNVRSQTEFWFHAIQEARPDWEGEIGIHHGSLDREVRGGVEDRLRAGTIKAVVCTSSLDLGVDFTPVEQVIQIGGPKGVARLLQRAGRCGHQPGAVSKVICVPTQAMEMVEYAAAREAIDARRVESREPIRAPLDLLSQHLVTIALGEGFEREAMLAEVRTAWSYRNLLDDEWQWTIDFVVRGGHTLRAYDQFRRVVEEGGRFTVDSKPIAKFHRMSIGTITSDQAMFVKFMSGKSLGTIEESFIAKVRPGSNFVFGGQTLSLVRVREMTAWVRKGKGGRGAVPVWGGGRSPLSSELANGVRAKFEEARDGLFKGREMKAVQKILKLQGDWSVIPARGEFLIEKTVTKEGVNWFVFPFTGRLAHEGLAALVGHRFSRREPMTISVSFNDYGLHLGTTSDLELTETNWRELLSPDRLLEDLFDCLNSTELVRRQFREVARVAGLVFQGYPGATKSARQVQASSSLFFEVFNKYDPENLLLSQSRKEVLDRQLEIRRLTQKLEEIQTQKLVIRETEQLTPFGFPLWAEGLRAQVSSEKWVDRVRRMVAELEAAARS